MASTELVLLTGATGYIGGRLLKELEARGRRIRCLARRPEFLRPRLAATTETVQGDVVGCWRVESIEPPRHLRLAAEMKLPGRAWLEFDVEPTSVGIILRQTATFDPVGLWGLACWYAVFPVHELVFRGMIQGLARAALASRAGTELTA